MPKKFLLLLLLLLVGCSQQERLPGYLYLRLGSDPTTLDPAFIVDASGGSIAAKLYDGLVGFDQAANIVPGLARSWEISPDGRVYTFHVRRDVKFSNGRMLTADDFKYSFERVLDPAVKSPRTWLFDRIAGAKDFMAGKAREVSGIRVLDGYKLEITLDAPFGPFLGLLAMPGAYACHWIALLGLRPLRSSHTSASTPLGSLTLGIATLEKKSAVWFAAEEGSRKAIPLAVTVTWL